MNLRLAGYQADSIVDGPGIRLAIFVQGCSHHCPGCHNPETHDPCGGKEIAVGRLVEMIAGTEGIDGVTISGGEPFEQAAASAELAGAVDEMGFDLVLYSGYTMEELLIKSLEDQSIRSLLERGRILVDGPFILEQQDLTLAFRGSRNQRLIDLPRSLAEGKAISWHTDGGN